MEEDGFLLLTVKGGLCCGCSNNNIISKFLRTDGERMKGI